jgi:hypothetical protein
VTGIIDPLAPSGSRGKNMPDSEYVVIATWSRGIHEESE